MILQERWYQEEASDALIEDLMSSFDENDNLLSTAIHGICVAPPGTGKSVMPCKVIDEFLTKFPEKTVLVVSHVEAVLEQNHSKLVEFFDGIRIGLWSAGIGLKMIEKITVVGIQSAYKDPGVFKNVGLIIIDECHLTAAEKGMYHKFIKPFPNVPRIGFTATPWSGKISLLDVKDPLFNKISYDISDYNIYNRLIAEGYLVPLIPLPTDFNMDEEGIRLIGGEFVDSDMSEKFDKEEVTNEICKRICKFGKKYKKWLIFAIDTKHAENISKKINELGFPCEALYTGSKRSKIEVLSDFRRGDLRAVVNVGMVVTGTDIAEIDMLVFARLTNSPVWHVQANGRGTRPVFVGDHDLNTIEGRLAAIKESGKTHTLVLDFARNARRLGPINGIEVEKKKESKGVTRIMAKSCKNCGTDNHLRAVNCIACNEEFEFAVKLKTVPSTAKILKEDKPAKVEKAPPRWLDVQQIQYMIHTKIGSPNMFKVIYKCKLVEVSQYICLDHDKWMPKSIALAFVKNRFVGALKDYPRSTKDLFDRRFDLKVPTKIQITHDGEFIKILDVEFEKGNNFPSTVRVLGKGILPASPNIKDFGVSNIFKKLKDKMKEETAKVDNWDDDIPF